ncbi:hypothetical protein ACFQ07_01670 [Actinomadura adrarensis]|uniref:Carboxylesterase family protein n=1 Tax=Actinomadura adrarensis TaxID=1819600 RepID=A0ABW3CBL2_9ACTN
MFATWAKLASNEGDPVAVSQAAADSSMLQLGWLSGRDLVQGRDGRPWTEPDEPWNCITERVPPVTSVAPTTWMATRGAGRSCLARRSPPTAERRSSTAGSTTRT